MKKIKTYIISILLGLLILKFLWVFDPLLSLTYDFFTQQNKKEHFSLAEYDVINFKDLPEGEKSKYLNRTCKDFSFENSKFIKINWFERYQNIIGNTKIYTFLTPDRLIRNRIRIPNLNKTQYVLLDPEVIHVYQKLIAKLKVENLNLEEIKITSGFRNPSYNQMVNGATCSQHQFGTAIDISIGDLNNDGRANQADRKLVYDILENKLVVNNGGIGKYKNSPKLIHFDTRGHRARW